MSRSCAMLLILTVGCSKQPVAEKASNAKQPAARQDQELAAKLTKAINDNKLAAETLAKSEAENKRLQSDLTAARKAVLLKEQEISRIRSDVAKAADLMAKAVKDQEDLYFDFLLLSMDDQTKVHAITRAMADGHFSLLEIGLKDIQTDLPVYFIRSNFRFFNTRRGRPLLLKWSEYLGVKKFLANVGTSTHENKESLMIEFALLPPLRDSKNGFITFGPQAALDISGKIKSRGIESLEDDEKQFVRLSKNLFFPNESK